MQAGIARALITPAPGTRMLGFQGRDRDGGCTGVHDDLWVRALSLEHDGETALLIALDLCFLGRADVARLWEKLETAGGWQPHQVLFNTSHTHAGPSVGTWADAGYLPPETAYLQRLDDAVLRAVAEATAARRPVTLAAGCGRTTLPLHRRCPDGHGGVIFAPYPDGSIHASLPVCRMRTEDGAPYALLFAVSCHPSTVSGDLISADYPGVATAVLDTDGAAGMSLFLQGAGGDAKPYLVADSNRWRGGTWDEVTRAGQLVADEVRAVVRQGLQPVTPCLRTALTERAWPLDPAPDAVTFDQIAGEETDPVRRQWALRHAALLAAGNTLPPSIPIRMHALQLGDDLRIVGIEGESVAVLGQQIENAFATGVTFALGYTDGAQLYLPTSAMLHEGGYEVESYYEYWWPAPLAPGIESHIDASLQQLNTAGIT